MSKELKVDGVLQQSGMVQQNKQRFVGLDLFRGIAAFAVVILHSDEVMTTQPAGWSTVLNLAAFAVPFFLAASFYLTVSKLHISQKAPDWQARLSRLLIPYACWSLIYVGQNVLRFVAKHQTDKLQNLLNNSLGLIFLGQAGFHLYFIPLLIIGTLVVIVLTPLIRRGFSLATRMGFVISSLIIYQSYLLFAALVLPELEIFSDTSDIGGVGRFILPILLTLLGYAARCLPYIAIALLLSHPYFQHRFFQFGTRDAILIFTIFVLVNSFDLPLFLQAAREIAIGYLALLLALAISALLQRSKLISNLGQCSFGIYLMHLLWVNALWSIVQRLNLVPETMPVLIPITIAALAFGISWIMTILLMQQRSVSRVLFGAS